MCKFYLLLNEKHNFFQRVTITLFFSFFFILRINTNVNIHIWFVFYVLFYPQPLTNLVQQELPTLPEHQSSPLVAQSLDFFFLDIILSVLEFTASDYPFGIFTIFLAVFPGLVFDWMLLI